MNVIEVKTKKEIDVLGSALTFEGLAERSFEEYLDWIDERAGLKERRLYRISGKTMNDIYMLTGDNRYPDNLTIACVDLDDMNDFTKIIFERFTIGARWLDDVVDNNLMREERTSWN